MKKTALPFVTFISIGIATCLPATAGPKAPCSPVEEAEFGEPVVCKTTLTKGGKLLVVRLYWDILADTDELHVLRIETAKSAAGKARATFDVDSRAPLTMEANGFEFGDFNFDGYTDFRLIEFLPAGPNVAYFNALYDPATGRHVASEDLNAISAPEFSASDKSVVSSWRSNAVTHGEDVYAWDRNTLVLQKRSVSVFGENGQCMVIKYEPRGRVTAAALGTEADVEKLLKPVYEALCN